MNYNLIFEGRRHLAPIAVWYTRARASTASFRESTVIDQIANLDIGSRPS
jgi:hypothetical protein